MRRVSMLAGAMTVAVWLLAPGVAMAAGNGSGGGGGGGETETEVGNNLSVPSVFVPTSTTTGAPALNLPCGAAQNPTGPRAGGYWLSDANGGIHPYGSSTSLGSLATAPNAPIVGFSSTANGTGYSMVAADGGVFVYGNAKFFGSMGGQHLNAPIVGMATTPTTSYWLVAADGGVFTYGNAKFAGSMGGQHLNQPIVGMAADPKSNGYWLVAADGGVFTYGGAKFYGSMGGTPLGAPVVGIVADQTTGGYRLVAADGGVFSFNAKFYGSMGGKSLSGKMVGMVSTPTGLGYAMAGSDGAVYTFGDATNYGSAAGTSLGSKVSGIAWYPGYWLQGGDAKWTAYCEEAASETVTASWGSNVTDGRLHADSPVRVEISLHDVTKVGAPYQGYTITNLTPTLEDRNATYGSDGTTFLAGVNGGQPVDVWGPDATLQITGPSGDVYNGAISAEINSGGGVVYGFNWGGGNSGTADPAGTYTLTFTIGTGITINAVDPGSIAQPTFTASSTAVTVTLS